MNTYQDLEKVLDDEQKKIAFVLGCIDDFKTSDEYKFFADAKQYYEGINPKLAKYQKIIYDMQGVGHVDAVSPNHKIFSRYVFSAVTEGTQYLLSNGVSFDNDATKEKLGGDKFDVTLQKLFDDAQVYGVGWGFWYYDDTEQTEKLSVIPPLQFVPLKDETTSAVRAGIRFWQIDDNKPLRFTLYEKDGYTEYIQEAGEKAVVLHEKRNYKVVKQTYGVNIPDEIIESENFPDFPIVPLYYINQKSLLWGNTAAVDAYDLLNSKMVNNIDVGSLVYWVLKNCNAMDENDDAAFVANLIKSHVVHADGDEGASAEPHQVEAPVNSTEVGIERIKQLLDENFMTSMTDSLRAGNITATQIKASYHRLDMKTSKAEYCVLDFIERLYVVAGIDKAEPMPTFDWAKDYKKAEEVQTILQAAQYLDEETVTRMLLTVLGKVDTIEEVLQRKASDELNRMNLNKQE